MFLIRAAVAVVVLSTLPTAFAQEAQGPQNATPFTLRAETRLAHADVTVLDKRTKAPVENLTAADFRVFDNEKEQSITNFSLVGKDDRPLALVLLVEVLGYDADVNTQLPAAATRAFAHLRPDDRVAVVIWGITGADCALKTDVAQPFTGDVAQLSGTLQRLADQSPTSRNECSQRREPHESKEERRRRLQLVFDTQDRAVRLAASTLATMPESRRELIAIDQDLSIVKASMADDTVDFLLHSGLSLNAIIQPSFMVGLVKGIAHSVDGVDYQSAILEFYADQTGGIVLSPKRKETASALEDLLFGIRAEYSLGWKPPAGEGLHKLRIELRKSGPIVHHRAGYFAMVDSVPTPSTPASLGPKP